MNWLYKYTTLPTDFEKSESMSQPVMPDYVRRYGLYSPGSSGHGNLQAVDCEWILQWRGLPFPSPGNHPDGTNA